MEREIGEIFKDGDVALKVVRHVTCKTCYYFNIDCRTKLHIHGSCAYGRTDRTPVHFVEVQESRSTRAMPILESILKFFGYKSK